MWFRSGGTEMIKLLGNKTFKGGFVLGIVLFLLAQVISFLFYFVSTLILMFKTPAGISVHTFWNIGFPFSMYYGMYDFFHGDIDFRGLVGNALFGMFLSFLIGWIFKYRAKVLPQN